jgi:DNA-binding protein H-NS
LPCHTTEDKREEILKTLEKIREELQTLTESRFLELQNRIDKIKTRLEVLKGIAALKRKLLKGEAASHMGFHNKRRCPHA